MKLQSVKDIKDLKDKRVLVRADFDVPTKSKVKSLKSKVVEVEDDYRIRAAVPTIKYLLDKEAIVILIAHLGRPKGRKDKDLSLQPVAEHLQKLLRRKVIFLPYGDFSKHENQVTKKGRVKIFVLENLRFWKGEESNSKSFAKELSSLADYYVNDAFAVCHRKHVSVSAINQYLPGYAGLSLEQEIGHLSQIMKKPRRPLLGVMGGVKISTKLPVMENLLKKVDLLVVGGALANNF
ncbi:phosphoglycerate kinase, partial [Patescibacteria group bacterium]|nr:phosphoglycerate kinase [Patescibacteria group bacterium]